MSWQVVEKDAFGTDWALVRYNDRALQRFEDEEKALESAVDYLTNLNVNNALTPTEKLNNIEAFMMTDFGCFLGTLDGEPWYMTYPKDVVGKMPDGSNGVIHCKGDIVNDKTFFLLEGKTEVAVRKLPGT